MNAKELKSANLANAARAGELIRFFLDGGNDSTYVSDDEVAMMALAQVNLLMDEDVHHVLVETAGYEFYRGPMGRMLLRRKGTKPGDTLRDLLPALENLSTMVFDDDILDMKLTDGCARDCARVLVKGNELLNLLNEVDGVAESVRNALREQINVLYYG